MTEPPKPPFEFIDEITNQIFSAKNLDETTKAILNLLRSHIKIFGGIIYMFDSQKRHLVTHRYSDLALIEKVLAPINMKVFNYRFPLDDDQLLLVKCVKKRKIQSAKELWKFFYPVMPKNHLKVIQKIVGVKQAFAIPILVQSQVHGVIFLAFREEKISKEKSHLIDFLGKVASMAIHNHLQLTELQHQYNLEKENNAFLSHELRTPITIAFGNIRLFEDFLKKNKKDLEPHLDSLVKFEKKLKSNVERLKHICNSMAQLRDVEANGCFVKHTIELDEFLNQTLELFRTKAERKGLEYDYEVQIESGSYKTYGIQFDQILTILIDNAIKYTDKGEVRVKLEADSKRFYCEVSDTGKGIPNAKKTKVFNRFYQMSPQSNKPVKIEKGMGLGLYIVKRMAEQLGGSITLQDNPNSKRGARFVVDIPYA